MKIANHYDLALTYAATKLEGIKYNLSDEDCLTHSAEVGCHLQELEVDQSIICAGCLHEVLDRTDTNPYEIANIFGGKVLKAIYKTTPDNNKPYQESRENLLDDIPYLTQDEFLLLFFDSYLTLRDINNAYQKYGNQAFLMAKSNFFMLKWYYESLLTEFILYIRDHEFTPKQGELPTTSLSGLPLNSSPD